MRHLSWSISFVAVWLIVHTHAQTVDPAVLEKYVKATVTEDEQTNIETVKIADIEGVVVSDVNIYVDAGYQVELPSDQKICLVRVADDNSTCYSEGPVTTPLPEGVLLGCEGRDIVMLTPAQCKEEVKGDAETTLLPVVSKRPPWSTCCRWRYRVSQVCMYRQCCRWFLFICTRRCCMQWSTQVVWTRSCTSGYTEPFNPL